MAGFDMQRVIAAFQSGQQIKQQREQKAQEAEDRQFQLKQREAQLRLDKINEQLAKRKLEQENAQAMQGMPAPEMSVSAPEASPMPFPGQVGAGPSMDGPPQRVPLPLPAQEISGVPEMGVGGYRQPVTSMQQLQQVEQRKRQQTLQDKAMEPRVLNQGDVLTAGGQTIATNPKPEPPVAKPASIQEYVFYVGQEMAAGRKPVSYDEYQAREANRRQPRIAPPQPPSAVQEYNFYRDQEVAAGRKPLSFFEYQQSGAQRAGAGTPGQPSAYSAERAARTVQSVDELIGKVGRWTTGLGSLLARIPATDARNFQAELDTLKANIAFNELTAMREASKTGGALGQVSNIELNLLQSALGALDAGQSPANLKAQLEKIKASVERWTKAAQAATPEASQRNPAIEATAMELGITYEQAEASLRKQGIIK